MKVAIAIEPWKLPIFSKHLTQAGCSFYNAGNIGPDVLVLQVETDDGDALRRLVETAQAEARRTGPPQGDELNPQHPVTETLHDHWHKLCAIAMVKLGHEHVVLTKADCEALAGRAITVKEDADGIHLRVTSMDVAQTLAAKHSGASWK